MIEMSGAPNDYGFKVLTGKGKTIKVRASCWRDLFDKLSQKDIFWAQKIEVIKP